MPSPSVHAESRLTLRNRLESELGSPSVDAQPNDVWIHARPSSDARMHARSGSATEQTVHMLNRLCGPTWADVRTMWTFKRFYVQQDARFGSEMLHHSVDTNRCALPHM